MKQTIKYLVAAFAALLLGVSAFAQVTTSSLNGQVADEAGEPLAGAAVIAVHTPSGTQYAAVANDNGRFVINGMRAGGPYTIEVSFIGMSTIKYEDVTLKLGDPYEIHPVMKTSNELDAVVLTAESTFGANQTGAGSNFGLGKIEAMPTVDRSIYDVVKFTPQATVNKDGGISIAGTSNRYNSFQIDGAVANDSFGLTKTGTNGGQTGANPIAMDAIEEIQVVVAPFDVRQSGFTGGAINAITKSGTNTVKGSFYGFFNNQDFIGTTAGPLDEGEERKKYETQTTQTYGFTIGAPIIKNKLFLFASAEYYRRNIPNIYTPANGSYEKSDHTLKSPITINGKEYTHFTDELAQSVIEHYQSTYNPGEGFSETTAEHRPISQSINAMLRLDWNINDNHKLMFRYQFMDAFQDKYSSGYKTYYFGNSSYKQSNQTHSLVAELNSRLSDMVYNEFRATAVMVRDERSVPYKAASMYIKDNITIDLGTEYSSGANSMASDTYTIEDNVMIYAGNHTITAGTHNEIYRFNNLFLQRAFGSYEFNSLADFFANKPSAFKYAYADPTVEGVDGPQWKATTWAAQFGLYVQDEWKPTSNFTLTYGLRADMPVLLNKPTENPEFNASTIASTYGEYVGVTPKPSVLFSPRVGFRWFIDKERKSVLRGGAGLFTGRIPFVWISNAYNNTGMETKSVTVSGTAAQSIPTTSDPYTDIILTGAASAGGKATINTLNENFKYPQVFRANLGFEQSFGHGWKFVFDGLYSKNLNNVFFKNLALSNNGRKVYPVNSSVDVYAPYYDIDKSYATVVALCNTNKGYTYTLSGQLQKHFDFGLDLMASYTFSQARSANDGISSVALSNWKQYYAVDTNEPDLSYSLYERPHKVMAVVSYTSPRYAKIMQTTVSLTYEGSSGQRFSYTYKDDVDFNGDDGSGNGNSLLYVPTVEEISMMNWASPSDALKFENQIRSDKYLSSRRGQWTERFGGIQPFEHHFDLHIAQDFFYDKKNGRKIQAVVDFMNISNLLNRNWGLSYNQTLTRSPLVVSALTKDENGNMTPTYKYNSNDNYIADFSSRWRCQVGLRLTF